MIETIDQPIDPKTSEFHQKMEALMKEYGYHYHFVCVMHQTAKEEMSSSAFGYMDREALMCVAAAFEKVVEEGLRDALVGSSGQRVH